MIGTPFDATDFRNTIPRFSADNRQANQLLVAVVGAIATARQVTPAQVPDSAKHRTVVTGGISITNKGISAIPTFTLGKPAAIVDLTVRKQRASFEPQFHQVTTCRTM